MTDRGGREIYRPFLLHKCQSCTILIVHKNHIIVHYNYKWRVHD